MRILDLYSCQGGASRGYADAGFQVVGIDIAAQPRYPFPFAQMDALEALSRLIAGDGIMFADAANGHDVRPIRRYGLEDFDAIHASPPCQLYSKTHRINLSDFPDLIEPTRYMLEDIGLPYVIENVEDARPELLNPAMLCGAMFGIETYRHRLFETNWGFREPGHPPHLAKTTKMGRAVKPGEFMHVVGNFAGVDKGRAVMGMPWASRDGLREAIPPVYSEWVGRELLGSLVAISTSLESDDAQH